MNFLSRAFECLRQLWAQVRAQVWTSTEVVSPMELYIDLTHNYTDRVPLRKVTEVVMAQLQDYLISRGCAITDGQEVIGLRLSELPYQPHYGGFLRYGAGLDELAGFNVTPQLRTGLYLPPLSILHNNTQEAQPLAWTPVPELNEGAEWEVVTE